MYTPMGYTMGMFLDANLQTEIRKALDPITQPVEMVLFTGSRIEIPGAEPHGLQDEALQLLREVTALNPQLSLVEKTLLDPEAQQIGLSRAPTILLREQGSNRHNIRFIGLPSGYEFATLLQTLLMLGTADSQLGATSQTQVDQIDSPVHLQTFVTPTCPHCPQAVLAAFRMAYHNPQVLAEGIEAGEFPRLSQQFRISGVPDTIITGKQSRRVLGGQPDRVFVQAALEAIQGVPV